MAIAVGAQFHGTWSDLTDDDRERILDALADAGITWVRIDVGWSMLQPIGRGKYDAWATNLITRVFEMAHKRGLKILCTFWRSPKWATGSDNRNVFPDDPKDYALALKWAARKWAAYVDAWEIWNEPNAKEFADPPDASTYAGLLRLAYDAVKAGNPNALVVFGGPMFVDTKWIRIVLEAGASPYFDVMAVHPYQGNAAKPPSAPATMGKRERLLNTDELLTLMAEYGDDAKPIWFTEFGWSTHKNTASTAVWFLGVSEAKQAQYLKEMFELVEKRYPTVTHFFWYTSRDLETGRVHQDNRGLLRKDFTPKPVVEVVKDYVRKSAAPVVRVISVADYSRSSEPTP